MVEAAHRFGGFWTEIKLEAVVEYLTMYTTALSQKRFDLRYVDGFAGTGERTQVRFDGGLLGEEPKTRVEVFAGSANRALDVRPPFRHFVFIERLRWRCDALERLKRQHPSRDIRVVRGDANDVLKKMMVEEPWSVKDAGPARGVVFLDPYAMDVNWDTLLALAATRALDVWYLFPLQAVLRNLAHDPDKIVSEEALDRTLGPEWRELYRLPPPPQPEETGLLQFMEHSVVPPPPDPEVRRDTTKRQVESWFHRRLQDVFQYVSDPLPILTGQGHDFSLFLAVANPSPKATELAKRFATYVNREYGPGAAWRSSGWRRGAARPRDIRAP
jgi:three-Cys-motif partner protein